MGGQDQLTATSSSGLKVSFDPGASANGACTVTGSTVTYDHALACTVTATQAGNDDYNAATRPPETFAIGKGEPDRSPSPRPPTRPCAASGDDTRDRHQAAPATRSPSTPGTSQRRLHRHRLHGHLPPRRRLHHRRRPGRQRRLQRRHRRTQTFDVGKADADDHLHLHRTRPAAVGGTYDRRAPPAATPATRSPSTPRPPPTAPAPSPAPPSPSHHAGDLRHRRRPGRQRRLQRRPDTHPDRRRRARPTRRSPSPPRHPTTPRSATPTTSPPPAATPATRSPSRSTPPPPTAPAPIAGSTVTFGHAGTASSPPTRPATPTTTRPRPGTQTVARRQGRRRQITFTSKPRHARVRRTPGRQPTHRRRLRATR